MTTNNSGKLNMGGVEAIKRITGIPSSKRTTQQSDRLAACLTALAHQSSRWYSYQDWGTGGPVKFLAERGIEFNPVRDTHPVARSWYDGCECNEAHWRDGITMPISPPQRRHVERYKGRLIKADPDDPRDWYVYCVGAKGCPVLYIGIATDPTKRFTKHMERFKEAPQPLSLKVHPKALQRVAARRMEIELHVKYPHARTVTTALEHLLALSNGVIS